jgi:hypothetical protein
MKIMTAVMVVVRLVTLVLLSWLVVGLASPTPDPFVIDVGWLLMITVVLAIPVSRRIVSRWVSTGRLRRTSG